MNAGLENVVNPYESEVFEDGALSFLHPGGVELTMKSAEVAKLNEATSVLDIACGRGASVIALSQTYGCRAVGIDRSHKLISVARSRAKTELPPGKVDLAIANAQVLPFRSSVFDVVLSECSFCLFPDAEKTATEIRRVLKSGGKWVTNDITIRGEISPESRRILGTFVPGFVGAKTVEEYIKLGEGIGLKSFYTEDCSEELKRMAYRMIVGWGSMKRCLAMLAQASGICSEDADSLYDVWLHFFKTAKPGYALMAFIKP